MRSKSKESLLVFLVALPHLCCGWLLPTLNSHGIRVHRQPALRASHEFNAPRPWIQSPEDVAYELFKESENLFGSRKDALAAQPTNPKLVPSADSQSPEGRSKGSKAGGYETSEIFSGAVSKLPSMLGAVYIFSALCFILCLRGLSRPETAKRATQTGILGMLAAVAVTFTEKGFEGQYLPFFSVVAAAAVVGVAIPQWFETVALPQVGFPLLSGPWVTFM
eukprot:GHVU01205033.1.p1 GENE.GHVU01205033.1~~GHVU01205033.1.p1  ORF type:complete len:221 (-),score=16.76 GHVU01205033.1:105-767(-)